MISPAEFLLLVPAVAPAPAPEAPLDLAHELSAQPPAPRSLTPLGDLLADAAADDASLWAREGEDSEEQPLKEWSGSITLGANLTSGNTNNNNGSAILDAAYPRGKDKFSLGGFWYYNDNDGEVTQRKYGGYFQYDRSLSEKLYLLGYAYLESDKQADIDLRYSLTGGAGYHWVASDAWILDTEGGVGWFSQDYSTEPVDDYVAARLAYYFEYKKHERWQVSQRYQIFPSLENAHNVYSRMDTRFKLLLTEKMVAQVQWLWEWNNRPAPGKESDDNLIAITFGWSF